MILVIGVDPGATTGVCILGSQGVVDAWQEPRNESHRRMVIWLRERKAEVKRVVIEDQFVGTPRRPKPDDPNQSQGTSPHAVIQVAKSAGNTEGWLLCAGYPENQIAWVLPQTWRSKLGIKGKGREEKEEQARQMAARSLGSLSRSQTHKAEAFCVAQYGLTEYSFSLASQVSRILPR